MDSETSQEQPAPRKPSKYGQMRRHAFRLWRGPGELSVDDIEGEPFYGWQVLRLTARIGFPDYFESRSVYTHLFDTEERFAVLRATSWDAVAAGIAARGHGPARFIKQEGDVRTYFQPKPHKQFDPERAKLVMPTRFVLLPIEQVRAWLAQFAEQDTFIEETTVDSSDNIPIRGLRIEWDYATCVFEKIWESQDARNLPLQRIWDEVWLDMGRALREAPVLPGPFEEDFETLEPDTSGYYFESTPFERVIPGIGGAEPEK